MLKIRLQRFGRKNDPKFRVVLTDSKNSAKTGKFLEILGFYNPVQKEKKIEGERIKYWIGQGAQASDTVHNILVKEKIINDKTINVLPKKRPIKKEEPKIEENKNATISKPETKENESLVKETPEITKEEIKTV